MPSRRPGARLVVRGRAPGKALRLCVGEVAVVSLAHVVESGVESSNGGHRPLPAFPRGGLLRQVTLDGLAYDLGDGDAPVCRQTPQPAGLLVRQPDLCADHANNVGSGRCDAGMTLMSAGDGRAGAELADDAAGPGGSSALGDQCAWLQNRGGTVGMMLV